MKILRILGIGLVVLALVVAAMFFARAPSPPAPGSESARRLITGPWLVKSADRSFVDRARPTAANGDFAGTPERRLEGTLWYPEGDSGAHPLLVYSHGFLSSRNENVPLVEFLASRGYVVVAVDYPLTSGGAPGGPNPADVVNQPEDIRFVIDQVLGWSEQERPFPGTIDSERIGTLGLSLGGLTTALVAFHPRLRDPRLKAAISIAGLTAMLDKKFFASADLPFLMIAGTGDEIVPFQSHAEPIPRKVARGSLLALEGGGHVSFTAFADRFPMRLLGNMDPYACMLLTGDAEADRRENPFAGIGTPEEGVVTQSSDAWPCILAPPDNPLPAGRQLMIAQLAAVAFFGSQFAQDPAERAAHETFLRETLPRDFPEASFHSPGAEVDTGHRR